MKSIYDNVSNQLSKNITKSYSTSFSLAVKMLSTSIRQDIYNIYGFVRLADEIVDTFHDYKKVELFERFERDLAESLEEKISLNPVLNAFQYTFHKYNIDIELVNAFMKSMKMDLYKSNYLTDEEYKEYIYGSADVVGLMCLQVFLKGDKKRYEELKFSAMQLGSAFQKVNFLRDIQADLDGLDRSYFPNVNMRALTPSQKQSIIEEIEDNFNEAYKGIIQLPIEARFGVYTAYKYYQRLLMKLKRTPAEQIMNTRVRVSNPIKIALLTRSYFHVKLNLL